MAITIERFNSVQSASIVKLTMEAGDTFIADFVGGLNASITWNNGGVSWTIQGEDASQTIGMKVEHSLMPIGDDYAYWTEDDNSPFTERAGGNESNRIQRIRFTADSGAGNQVVVIASNADIAIIEP